MGVARTWGFHGKAEARAKACPTGPQPKSTQQTVGRTRGIKVQGKKWGLGVPTDPSSTSSAATDTLSVSEFLLNTCYVPGTLLGGGKECSHDRDRQVPAIVVVGSMGRGEEQESQHIRSFQTVKKTNRERQRRRWHCVRLTGEGLSGEEATELSPDGKKDVAV